MSFLKHYLDTAASREGDQSYLSQPLMPKNGLGTLGLELESEGRGLPNEGHLDGIKGEKTKSYWLNKKDGSLRGEAWEYVLSKPCNAEELPVLVGGLYKKFNDMGTKLRLSNRCSTHVHYNVSGWKMSDLISGFVLWSTFEDALINWCGRERFNNHFCVPTSVSSFNSDALVMAVKGKAAYFDLHEGAKYTALNLLTVFNIGSIETRCMRASPTPLEIIQWAMLVNNLFTYSKTKYVIPSLIANDVSEKGLRELFMEICQGIPGDFYRQVVEHPDNRNFEFMCREGFRGVQELSLGFNWEAWLPAIRREHVANPFENRPVKGKIRIGGLDVRAEDGFRNRQVYEPEPGLDPARPLDWDEFRAVRQAQEAVQPNRARGVVEEALQAQQRINQQAQEILNRMNREQGRIPPGWEMPAPRVQPIPPAPPAAAPAEGPARRNWGDIAPKPIKKPRFVVDED